MSHGLLGGGASWVYGLREQKQQTGSHSPCDQGRVLARKRGSLPDALATPGTGAAWPWPLHSGIQAGFLIAVIRNFTFYKLHTSFYIMS